MSIQTATSAPAGRRRNLWPLWVMIAVFAAPVVATWFYYFFPDYLPEARSNRGEIINPAIGLPEGLDLRTLEGAPFDANLLEGAWTLVYLADRACSQSCVQRLVELRQIRLGLGENRNFVERLLLIADPQGPVDQGLMDGAFEGMRVAVMDRSASERLLSALGSGPEALDRVYILDPQGRLMMRYAADALPKDTLKDMERLLKGSKHWIKGASYGHN
jgi:cytochrome oxidase Cu insertion factor (SCO1/SenC/PrrC family)